MSENISGRFDIRRLICLILCFVTLLPFTASAQEPQTSPAQTAENDRTKENKQPVLTAEGELALVYNLDYSRVLWSVGEEEKISPASFVKIMTAALAFEYAAENPKKTVTVSEYAAKAQGTKLGLKAGEEIPFDELLYGLVLGSANDAAIAIAEEVAGSEAEFVSRMNAKAKELGMRSTYFANPTGMDNSAMYTTLRDVASLCAFAYRFNDYVVMATEPRHTIPATNLSKERTLKTKNLLVDPNKYSGYYTPVAQGFCAGGTQNSGYCVATSFVNGSLSYVVLITGGKYQNDVYSSFTDAKTLIRYTVDNFKLATVILKDQVVGELPVKLGKGTDSVMVVSKDQIQTLLPVDYDKALVETEKIYNVSSMTAPVEKGVKVGDLRVIYDGQLIGATDIVTQRTIELSVMDSSLKDINDFFDTPWVKRTIIIVLCVVAALILGGFAVWLARHRKKTADERKAVKEYLKKDRERFREQKKQYRIEVKEKRERRLNNYLRIRNNYAKYKEEKRLAEEKAAREMARRDKQRSGVAPQPRPRSDQPRRSSPSPQKPPVDCPGDQPQQPPIRRKGDEYYNK